MGRKPPAKVNYEREHQALELRKAGASYDQIAQQLGLAGKGVAHNVVMRALKAFMQEPCDDVRALEVSRLDQMLLGVWQQARSGHIGAIQSALRIMERRSAYLGLDAPKRSELSGPDGEAIQIDQVNTIVLTDDDRAERVTAVLQRARARALGPAPESEPYVAPVNGSTNGSVAH